MLTSNRKVFIVKVLILCFILLSIFSTFSFAVVSPTSDFYVNDYANLLSSDTKNYIIRANKQLNARTGAQIVVVTIPTLGNNSLEEYATELFRKFGIGDKSKNNGVLLLLALEERQFRIEVGYGLEGILPDAKTGRIQDEYIIPYLKQNNWDDGIKNGFSAVLQVVANEYDVSLNSDSVSPVKADNSSSYSPLSSIFRVWIFPFISLIFGMVIRFSVGHSLRRKRALITFGIYLVIATVIQLFISGFAFSFIPYFILFNLVAFIYGLFLFFGGGRGSSGGFSGGGGSFGGGGSSGGRRKFTKFLKICLYVKRHVLNDLPLLYFIIYFV